MSRKELISFLLMMYPEFDEADFIPMKTKELRKMYEERADDFVDPADSADTDMFPNGRDTDAEDEDVP